MRRLRIGKNCKVILYDHVGMFAVARAAWMFRYFGVADVKIMNGGLQKWLKEGREVYSGSYTDGMGLPEENDYDFCVKTPETAVTDINKVYSIATEIFKGGEGAAW